MPVLDTDLIFPNLIEVSIKGHTHGPMLKESMQRKIPGGPWSKISRFQETSPDCRSKPAIETAKNYHIIFFSFRLGLPTRSEDVIEQIVLEMVVVNQPIEVTKTTL